MIPFGKYLLLERLAVGGMAEVYLAKSFGVEGFEKILAVKRILPTMAEDQDFIEMFVDEAKIAGSLTHANIAPIYELGKIGESHYIAMEYVWGKDLLQIMNRFRRLRKNPPAEMVAWVGMRMCEALDYAHNKRDKNGVHMNIIHRDISPQNVLVSYEGEVKLIDFGIAKAASRTTKTQAGVLKGKFGYMSPEQVRGLPIDQRSDLFAVGTCMYEMLTSDRLFLGESDFSTLERVRNVVVQPVGDVNKEAPKEFADIVMRTLSRAPEDRWNSAQELHGVLEKFLRTRPPPFGTSKLSAWMKTAFAKEMEGEKEKLESFTSVSRPVMDAPPPTGPVSSSRVTATIQADQEIFDDDLSGDATMVSDSPFDASAGPLPAPPGNLPPSGAPSWSPPASPGAPVYPNLRPGLASGEIASEATEIFFSSGDIEMIDEGPPPVAEMPTMARAQMPMGPGGVLPALNPAGPVSYPGIPTPVSSGRLQVAPIDPPSVIVEPAQEPQENKKLIFLAAAVVLVMLGVGGAIGYALTQSGDAVSAMQIRTDPTNAEVLINGAPAGRTPVTLERSVGQIELELRLDGHEPLLHRFELTEGRAENFMFSLEESPELPADTPTPSMVDPPVAEAPETQETQENTGETTTDTTTILAEAQEAEREAAAIARQEARERERERQATNTQMTVLTQPEDVRPVNMQTPVETPTDMQPARGFGTLTANSTPWSVVYVNGRRIGNTPVLSHRLRSGSYQVRFENAAGAVVNRSATVRPNEDSRVIVRF